MNKKRSFVFTLYAIPLFLISGSSAAGPNALDMKVLDKEVPNVTWEKAKYQKGDFNCDGKIDHAYLGKTQKKEIVVAVVLGPISASSKVVKVLLTSDGLTKPTLSLLSLDYNDKKNLEIPGFKRSKTCLGLTLSPGESDNFYLFWNHESKTLDYYQRG